MTGVAHAPVMANSDAVDEEFAQAAKRVLLSAVESIRTRVCACWSAALVVQKEWSMVHRFFSLSKNYEH